MLVALKRFTLFGEDVAPGDAPDLSRLSYPKRRALVRCRFLVERDLEPAPQPKKTRKRGKSWAG